MQGLEEFERLRSYRGNTVSIGIGVISDTWDREGEYDDDVFDSSKSEKKENYLFDNIYLSRKNHKLAFIGVSSGQEAGLFLPFNYNATEVLKFRDFRRDITWKIESISIGDIKIKITDEKTESLRDSLENVCWENRLRGDVLVSKTLKFPMCFEDLPKCAEIYPLF
jgi:hypothetical protein